MSSNAGTFDRILRVVLGLALVGFALYPTAIAALAPYAAYAPLGWAGLILIGTALVGWCPIYAVLGIRTCSRSTA